MRTSAFPGWRAAAALAASLSVGLAGCALSDHSDMPGMGGSANPRSAGPSTLVTPAIGPHNGADVMFAQMMIPHHEQAVEMSDLILAKDDVVPGVRRLAQQIKTGQTREIAQMRGWLAGWGLNPSPSMGGMHHGGGGMLSEDELQELEEAGGQKASRLFLIGMIPHHRSAIVMARLEAANGDYPEATALANDIVAAQQAEITTMQDLLRTL